MWEYDLEYAETKAADHHIYIVRRPSIPTAKRKYTEVEVPGRDGLLYIDEETIEDINIPIEMNFMGKHDEWFEYWREAKRWLMTNGINRLRFGDDPNYFYLAKKVEISESERTCYEIGRFTAVFTCSGYQYLQDGWETHKYEDITYNPYNIAHPIYMITGEGVCKVEVNEKTVTANVGQNLTIDTDLMIAYRTDGTMMNTSVAGKYEDLYLQPGENTIKITDGFSMEIIPRWRCL